MLKLLFVFYKNNVKVLHTTLHGTLGYGREAFYMYSYLYVIIQKNKNNQKRTHYTTLQKSDNFTPMLTTMFIF